MAKKGTKRKMMPPSTMKKVSKASSPKATKEPNKQKLLESSSEDSEVKQ
jgi:hypothetical protein